MDAACCLALLSPGLPARSQIPRSALRGKVGGEDRDEAARCQSVISVRWRQCTPRILILDTGSQSPVTPRSEKF